MAWGEEGHAESIYRLATKLVAETKAYVGAEIAVVRQTAVGYVRAAVPGIVLAIVAIVLALATLPVLIAALGMLLARWLGVPGGLFAAVLLVLVVAGVLGWLATRRLAAIGDSVK